MRILLVAAGASDDRFIPGARVVKAKVHFLESVPGRGRERALRVGVIVVHAREKNPQRGLAAADLEFRRMYSGSPVAENMIDSRRS